MRQRFGSLFGSSMRMRLRLWLGNRKWDEKLTWKPPREREKVTEKWRERESEKERMLAALNAISERVGCCLSVVVQAYYLEPSRRWAGGRAQRGRGQGSLSGSVGSVPIRSLFHKQTRLPRRSFNKVCRRLGIKISCELALIFYLFVFAVWLSVFCSPSLPSPSSTPLLYLFLALYSHSSFCCGLLLINSKSFSTRMRAVSVRQCVCVCAC